MSLQTKLDQKGSFYILYQIWRHLKRRRKFQFLIFTFLNIFSSFSETFSIAMTLPLISVLIDPNQLWKILTLRKIFIFIGINSSEEILIPITIIFIIASIISTLVKLFILRTNNFFAAAIGNDLSSLAYSRTLYQPYEKHIERNSSEIIAASTAYVDATREAIYCLLNLFSYSCFVITIEITLFFFNWRIALSSIFIFGISYFLVAYRSKQILLRNGKIAANLSKERVQSIQEGLGSIRDVLLGSKQKVFINHYSNIDRIYRRKLAANKFITFSPRFIIENIGFIFIAILAYTLSVTSSANNALPVLATFGVAAQKLLPSMQQCYNSIGTIRSNKSSIMKVLDLLKQINISYSSKGIKPLNFKNTIFLSDISFKYINSNKFILKDIHLKINKGQRVGIIGTTGSGKTTLTDIIMGLLKPNNGKILIDGQNLYQKDCPEKILQWRLAISHVPQNIFLSDSSIAENIAFGIPLEDIDFEKVKEAAKKAQIYNFIKETKNQYLTKVGENGLKLSGGQRQRIGIARALYHDSQILIFDEATSALDSDTENSVIEALNILDPDLTIFIVAHRLTTIEKCNRVIKVEDSRIKEIS